MSEAIAALDEFRAPELAETRPWRELDDAHLDDPLDGWSDDRSADPVFESLVSSAGLAPVAASGALPRRRARVRAEDLVALTVVVGAQIAWLSVLAVLAVTLLR